jgi:DNA-directed RNA polymerase alpha subunit
MGRFLRFIFSVGFTGMVLFGGLSLPVVHAQSFSQPALVLAGIDRTAVSIVDTPETKAVREARRALARAQAEADRLQAALAALDEQFDNGEISQEKYAKQRQKLANKIAAAEKKVRFAEAKQALAEAKALRRVAKKELKQAEKNFKKGLISQAELDAKRQALAEAQRAVQLAKHDLKNLNTEKPKFSPSA